MVTALFAQVAGAAPYPFDRAALVLLRALAYDQSTAAEAGPLHVAIVHDERCATDAAAIDHELERLAGVQVAGRPLAAPTSVRAAPGTDWEALARGADALLVCATDALPALAAAADRFDVPLISLDEAQAGRGPTLVLFPRADRLVIAYDTRAAEAQGVRFGTEMLELVTPVEPR